MEVLLKSEYKKLGKKGSIISVKGGYGRNYLIPKGIAVVANSANKKVALENAKQVARRALKLKSDAQSLLNVLSTAKVVVRVKVGEGGNIFGSVTPLQIAKALQEQGIAMSDYTKIRLDVAIKRIGSYQAELILHEEVSYTLHFNVVAA